jgi:hypothetical protein
MNPSQDPSNALRDILRAMKAGDEAAQPPAVEPPALNDFLAKRLSALEAELKAERERAVTAETRSRQQDDAREQVEAELRKVSDLLRREREEAHARGRIEALEQRLDEMQKAWMSSLSEMSTRMGELAAARREPGPKDPDGERRTLDAALLRIESSLTGRLNAFEERIGRAAAEMIEQRAKADAPINEDMRVLTLEETHSRRRIEALESRLEETQKGALAGLQKLSAQMSAAAPAHPAWEQEVLRRDLANMGGALKRFESGLGQSLEQAVAKIGAQQAQGEAQPGGRVNAVERRLEELHWDLSAGLKKLTTLVSESFAGLSARHSNESREALNAVCASQQKIEASFIQRLEQAAAAAGKAQAHESARLADGLSALSKEQKSARESAEAAVRRLETSQGGAEASLDALSTRLKDSSDAHGERLAQIGSVLRAGQDALHQAVAGSDAALRGLAAGLAAGLAEIRAVEDSARENDAARRVEGDAALAAQLALLNEGVMSLRGIMARVDARPAANAESNERLDRVETESRLAQARIEHGRREAESAMREIGRAIEERLCALITAFLKSPNPAPPPASQTPAAPAAPAHAPTLDEILLRLRESAPKPDTGKPPGA